jgi:glyoxylase-like metal-dependent hydrolase (beta-lactamase superfamily II)
MLHDQRHGRLIAADVVLLAPVPFLDWGHTPDPLGDHLDSILRVRELGPALLVPGHGRPVEDVEEQVEYALGAALGVRDRVREIVARGPATPYEVLCRFVPEDADLDTRQAGLATVLSALDHLELRGEVASMPGPDGARLVTPA